ncbi:MAG TPA: hypothetical protein VN765_08155 [Candidatus Acidoferrum sp.]|nr:hypothetical protein [Candidatus Acidoferrum sp.]
MNGLRAAKVSFWCPFGGTSVFILAVTAGATKAAGHPVLMFAVVGICNGIFAGGLWAGMAGLRRMKAEGRAGILGRALSGVVLNGVLLGFMLWLTGFLIRDAQRTAAERERQADLEVQQLRARVGGGAALEKALMDNANESFTLDFQELQKRCDAAWKALTNPPVLDMGLVKTQADLRGREEAARRWIGACQDLGEFTEKMPEIYRRELLRHKLSPEARAAGLQKFVDALAAVNPTLIALRRAQVREGEALLRAVQLLDRTWGQWEYRPATHDIFFKDAGQADDYNLAYKEFDGISSEARNLQEQLKPRGP